MGQLLAFGRERQWGTEGGEGNVEFPFWSLFFLACVAHCQGVCAELGLGPGRGQSQGGPFSLPAGRRCHGHFRHWQALGAGLSAQLLLAKPSISSAALSQIPGAPHSLPHTNVV